MASEVRPFVRNDVPAVADLFMRVFRKSRVPAPDSLTSYFVELYLDNPWTSTRHPSFVYCDGEGRVRGFIGVIPLPMTIRKRRFIASVAGNHMVDPELKDPFAGVLLLKKLFASNSTLTISDSANEVSKTLWTKLGGSVLTLQSMRWVRILQPARYLFSLIPKESTLSRVGPVVAPLCAIADVVGSRFFKPSSDVSIVSRADDSLREVIPKHFREVIGERSLVPEYSQEGLAWLLDIAARKEQFGKLFTATVKHGDGGVAGWYMYYAMPGAVAQVLQFAARPDMTTAVLNHLFSHAAAQQSIAVMGGMEAGAVKEFSENQCMFFLRNVYTVAYSQDQEITAALLNGDVFLSRLEGEWWTRLQGDTFS